MRENQIRSQWMETNARKRSKAILLKAAFSLDSQSAPMNN